MITNLLPLDFWRAEMSYHPWKFWGWAHSSLLPITSKCNDIVKEYAWQSADALGRNEIRQAIATAEQRLFDHLRYWPAPKYSEDTLAWPYYNDHRLYRVGQGGATGQWLPIVLNEGYVLAAGTERLELIGEADVVYADSDLDGLSESWSAVIATTVTDPGEIAAYFLATDLPDGADPQRVEPVRVKIAAGSATIRGSAWYMARPVLYEGAVSNQNGLDPTVTANFAQKVNVYRRYTYKDGQTSADAQGALIWESRPWPYDICGTTDSSSDPAATAKAAARVGVRDIVNGVVTPGEAVYNSTTGTWSNGGILRGYREPDRVLVRYLAGVPLDASNHINRFWRTVIARLSAAEMTRTITACDTANREFYTWQFDVSRVNNTEEYQINIDDLQNPFGTRRGHIHAWSVTKTLARVTGVIV